MAHVTMLENLRKYALVRLTLHRVRSERCSASHKKSFLVECSRDRFHSHRSTMASACWFPSRSGFPPFDWSHKVATHCALNSPYSFPSLPNTGSAFMICLLPSSECFPRHRHIRFLPPSNRRRGKAPRYTGVSNEIHPWPHDLRLSKVSRAYT